MFIVQISRYLDTVKYKVLGTGRAQTQALKRVQIVPKNTVATSHEPYLKRGRSPGRVEIGCGWRGAGAMLAAATGRASAVTAAARVAEARGDGGDGGGKAGDGDGGGGAGGGGEGGGGCSGDVGDFSGSGGGSGWK